MTVAEALADALRRITPDDPLDIDQDCKFCGGHFHHHFDDCDWAAANAALAAYEESSA